MLRSLGTVASSGGWVRASGLPLFRRTLLPSELHRNHLVTVPRPGIEPGPAPSEGDMMSVSPPGQKAPGAGVGPTPTGSEPAVLPLDDPGMQVAREGVEPSRPVGTAF